MSDLVMRWYHVWFTALTRPTTTTYQQLLENAQTSGRVAYIWIAFVGLALGLLLRVLDFVFTLQNGEIDTRTLTVKVLGLILLPIVAGLGFVGLFSLQTGTIWISAKLLRGQGAFGKLAYARAAVLAPTGIVYALSGLLPESELIRLLTIPLDLYVLALGIVAVKATYGFTTGRAIVAGLIIPVVLILAFLAVVPLIMNAVAPVITGL